MDVHDADDDDEDEIDEPVVKPKKKKTKRSSAPTTAREPIDLSFLTTLNVGKHDNVTDLVFSDDD